MERRPPPGQPQEKRNIPDDGEPKHNADLCNLLNLRQLTRTTKSISFYVVSFNSKWVSRTVINVARILRVWLV